jgi:hypothetical protein
MGEDVLAGSGRAAEASAAVPSRCPCHDEEEMSYMRLLITYWQFSRKCVFRSFAASPLITIDIPPLGRVSHSHWPCPFRLYHS